MVKDYMIYDHLGSVRAVPRADAQEPYYNIVSQYDYDPFGQIITSYGNNSRNKYIGKEKDVETAMNINFEGGLADHGVRKYEDYTGRFTTPEPLWEKYYSWSPYVYSANNPIIFIDGNGMNYGFFVDQNKDSHTTLFFQDQSGQWWQYDQGAAESPSDGSRESHILNIDMPAYVTMKTIKEDKIPSGTVYFETTPQQDASITSEAIKSTTDHNILGKKYNLYSNNCTDASVDVINKALGINFYNPFFIVDPKNWFEQLKKWDKAKKDAPRLKEIEESTSPSSSAEFNITK